MPHIERIRAIPYNIPLKSVLAWGKQHKLAALDHVLIEVTLSDGARGFAEATPRPTIYGETQQTILHITQEHLTLLLMGQNIETVEDIDALETRLSLIRNNNTAKGALNIALHMTLAQSMGISLSTLLNTAQQGTRVSYIVSTGQTDEVLQDVEQIYQAGVRVFKVKIGKDVAEEISTLQNLHVCFPEADFYVDANQCLQVDTAAALLDQLVDMGVIYCEEALPVHQLRSRQRLAQSTRMPIVGDDSCFTVDDVSRELEFETVDILNIKTPRTGFSQSRRIQEMGLRAGKGIMIGSQASSLLGCLHAALFASRGGIEHPTECSFFLKTQEDLQLAPPIQDGYLSLEAVEDSLSALFQGLSRETSAS